MDKLPTDAGVAIERAGISAGDAMTHGADAAELFDIEMDELAWFFAFITPDRFGRLQGTKLVQPQPTQNTADRSWLDARLGGGLLAFLSLSGDCLLLPHHTLGPRRMTPTRL